MDWSEKSSQVNTLGSLNLYRSALDSATSKRPPVPVQAIPTMETFKGFMLAALIGKNGITVMMRC
jgi:hypothetical protein